MGPNNLRYVTRHFLFFPYVAISLFIRPWRHFLQFYKSPHRTSTNFKVAASHFVFYPCRALKNKVRHRYYKFKVVESHVPFEIKAVESDVTFLEKVAWDIGIKIKSDAWQHKLFDQCGALDILVMGYTGCYGTFLWDLPTVKKIWHFEILTWQLMGNTKM